MVRLKWYEKLPRLTDDIGFAGEIADDDTDTDVDHSEIADQVGILADLFITIEYTNSGGVSSRRSVTIKREADGSAPGFYAFCHKRKSVRQFRFDRIGAVITVDGEVFEPASSFWEHIGYNPAIVVRTQIVTPDDRQAATWAKRKFNHELVVLAALSGSDGNMHERELDAIVDYVERELEWERFSLEETEALALRNHVKRMRITRERVEQSVNELLHGQGKSRLYSRQLERFLSVARQVVDADGVYHNAEHEFLSFLADHMNNP